MALINRKKKEVQVKIVYYGPGRGGKTTNLEFINNKFQDRIQSKMVTVKTHGDRTLFFDFLPFDIGKIKGYDIKIQLYTVPGQVKYNATRKRPSVLALKRALIDRNATVDMTSDRLTNMVAQNIFVYCNNIE